MRVELGIYKRMTVELENLGSEVRIWDLVKKEHRVKDLRMRVE